MSSKLLKSSFGVAAATFASRVCGLLRVRLESAVLGGGALASAWFLAFMIPNLFRRLLGEGALGTALIPLVAEIESDEGIPAVRRKLAVILTALGALLALIVVTVSTAAAFTGKFAVGDFWQSERISLMMKLLVLLMPYAFFICLTGVVGSVLNYAGIFVRPALTALLFNLFMLTVLSVAYFGDFPAEKILPFLAVATPVAGAVQLGLMLWMLWICGRFPVFGSGFFAQTAVLVKLFRLAAPGIIGYGALQLSFLVDRAIAVSLGDKAVPALTYVDRIIDLPIGIFAVSLGSVLMASMSRAAAAHDGAALREQLEFALRHVWFICAPMAAAVVFFHADILRVLCLGGRYTMADLYAARQVAVFYGCGIPLFCSLKVLLPAFYARKQMKLPLYVSLITIAVNIVLNFILMHPLKQGGIALATLISSLVHNFLLLFLLARQGYGLPLRSFWSPLASLIAAFASGAAVFALLRIAGISVAGRGSLAEDALLLAGIMILFGAIYFACRSRSPEIRQLLQLLRRKQADS